MNSLSLSIYIIYLIGNLHSALLGIAVIFTVSNIALFIYHACNLDLHNQTDAYMKHNREKRTAAGKRIVIGLPIFIALGAIFPDKQTAVLIAASQVGEKLITNERVTAVVDPSVDLLRTWIQNELSTQKAKLSGKAVEIGANAAKKIASEVKKKIDE